MLDRAAKVFEEAVGKKVMSLVAVLLVGATGAWKAPSVIVTQGAFENRIGTLQAKVDSALEITSSTTEQIRHEVLQVVDSEVQWQELRLLQFKDEFLQSQKFELENQDSDLNDREQRRLNDLIDKIKNVSDEIKALENNLRG